MQYLLIPVGVLTLTVLNVSAKNFTQAEIENPIQKEVQTEEPDVYPEFPGGGTRGNDHLHPGKFNIP